MKDRKWDAVEKTYKDWNMEESDNYNYGEFARDAIDEYILITKNGDET